MSVACAPVALEIRGRSGSERARSGARWADSGPSMIPATTRARPRHLRGSPLTECARPREASRGADRPASMADQPAEPTWVSVGSPKGAGDAGWAGRGSRHRNQLTERAGMRGGAQVSVNRRPRNRESALSRGGQSECHQSGLYIPPHRSRHLLQL